MALTQSQRKIVFNVYAAVLAFIAIFCAILMTEPGQLLGLRRDWVLGYYENMILFIAMQAVATIFIVILHFRWRIWSTRLVMLSVLGVLCTFWAENYMMPMMFPTQQFNAKYYSVEEADKIMAEDKRVYVVTIGNETRIFPRYQLQISHVAGWEENGTDYAITYCGLSNLPMVVETDYGLGESDLQVLGQVNNNLVFKDVKNGTAIQQITMQSEFTDHSTTVHPNTMMEWDDAKESYPNAKVYIYDFRKGVDPALLALFDEPLTMQRDPTRDGFIFPTLDLDDQRINPKIEIFGYDNKKAQVAIHPEYAKQNNGQWISVGGERLQIEYLDDIFRLLDEKGKQVATHNGVHFGIWAQFFPDTQVLTTEKVSA